jgi:SAM-dependent methyltransferase
VDDYRSANRANWDERAPAHAKSPDYAVDRFIENPEFISQIGTDTISLARLGARMSGLDFSLPALEEARRLAIATGAEVDFVHSDIYDAVEALGAGQFDLVYTGIGALNWLPDVGRWAGVVANLLKPDGRLFLREGHPMMWALEDGRIDGLLVVENPYFERAEPMIWSDGGTYVRTDASFEHNTKYEWNHGIGEIVTALVTRGMRITGLVEHDSVPWEALPGQMETIGNGEFRLADRPWRLPHSYTLQAVRTHAG